MRGSLMTASHSINEYDDFFSVSEELINQLPDELRKIPSDIINMGKEIAGPCGREIENLIKVIRVTPTILSLKYIYKKLRSTKFEETLESMLEHEVLTSSFSVSYARLFNKGNGAYIMRRSDLPAKFRTIHDELCKLRNERYAHNGGHQSIDTNLTFAFDGESRFYIQPQMTLGFYLKGRDEWEGLINYIDGFIYDRISKIIGCLNEKTGCEWLFPNGEGKV